MLQESCIDQSGSLVVYTTIDVNSIQLAMNGEDPSCIPLLPLGFVIVPMESFGSNTNSTSSGNDVNEGNSIPMLRSQDGNNGQNNPSAGCLLTVGLPVLASTIPSAKINLSTVTAINTHLCNTVNQINAALTTATTPTTCRQTIV
uniref:HD-Zip IV C-terminal domain-containing protein n=1 Tax=Rhizophora mucronata TaxID=61149 RepID=A0A2P2NVM4_RHIMU